MICEKNMTNEDIIKTLEEFAKWSEDDKRVIINSLSLPALRNLVDLADKKKIEWYKERSLRWWD